MNPDASAPFFTDGSVSPTAKFIGTLTAASIILRSAKGLLPRRAASGSAPTGFPKRSLAHKSGDKVLQAYERIEAIKLRRKVMEA